MRHMKASIPLQLATACLDLIAATLEHVCAELEAPERLAAMLSATVEPGWPPGEYDRGAQEFFRERLQAGGDDVVGWYGWYAVRRATSDLAPVLVGAGGFLGPPNERGEVEIGFSIVPNWYGQGLATELVCALVGRALADSGVQKIIAHTTEQNQASCKVLKKSGFRLIGNGMLPGSIRFELEREK